MPVQRAILVDGSRFVRELLKRVIEKNPDIEVIREVNGLDRLPAVLNETNPDWLFVVLSPENDLPGNFSDQLLAAHPTLRIIVFWTDGSHVKMEWLGRKEREIDGNALTHLTNLFQQEMWTDSNKEAGQETKDN